MYTVIPTEQFEKDVRQGSPMVIVLFIMLFGMMRRYICL